MGKQNEISCRRANRLQMHPALAKSPPPMLRALTLTTTGLGHHESRRTIAQTVMMVLAQLA